MSTGQQQRFSGLRALASKLGMGASTSALGASGAGAAPGDENDDDREEGEQPGEPGEQGGPGDPGTSGDGDEENGDGDDANANGGAGGGAADAGGSGEGEGNGNAASADYQRGLTAGDQRTAGRWAATLLNASCRANIELATDLLADTSMTPDQIGAYCSRNPGASAAGAQSGLQRLATTPQPKVGLETGGENGGVPGEQDEARASRKSAVKRVSDGVRANAARAGVQTRRAGGPRKASAGDGK